VKLQPASMQLQAAITVTITDDNGCSVTSDPVIVTVNDLPDTPTITADGPLTFCKGGSVTLTSSPAAGYQWYKTVQFPPFIQLKQKQ